MFHSLVVPSPYSGLLWQALMLFVCHAQMARSVLGPESQVDTYSSVESAVRFGPYAVSAVRCCQLIEPAVRSGQLAVPAMQYGWNNIPAAQLGTVENVQNGAFRLRS